MEDSVYEAVKHLAEQISYVSKGAIKSSQVLNLWKERELPKPITLDVSSFANWAPYSVQSVDSIMKVIKKYIITNHLQDPEDPERFLPDKRLSDLFHLSSSNPTFTNMQKQVVRHGFVDDNDVVYKFFNLCCYKTNLENIQNYYSRNNMTLKDVKDCNIFHYTCEDGYLELAKWLWSLGLTLDDVRNKDTFNSACREGRLEVVQWLWSLGLEQSDIRTSFHYACMIGQFGIARWLWSTGFFGIEDVIKVLTEFDDS